MIARTPGIGPCRIDTIERAAPVLMMAALIRRDLSQSRRGGREC